jgi:DNA-binding protein YbaB
MTFDFDALRSMRDPHDMITHLEGLRTQAEQQIAQLQQAKDAVAAITVTCSDPNGLVEVTIGSDANLRSLVIAPHVARQQYHALGRAIVAALGQAREELQEKLNEVRPR